MRIPYRIMLCCAAAFLAFSPLTVYAAKDMNGDSISTASLPVVLLKHWKNSSITERHAFLMGFVSMIQMEYAWQGKKPLPVKSSTAASWMRGLDGVTIQKMDTALNDYIDNHPDSMEKTVIEILGRLYVRPKLTDKERDIAAKRVEILKTEYQN